MYISYQSFVFGSFDRRFGKYTIIILTGKTFRSSFRRKQSRFRTECLYLGRAGETVPGADLLAGVATVEAVTESGSLFGGDFSAVLDGEIGEAFAGIQVAGPSSAPVGQASRQRLQLPQRFFCGVSYWSASRVVTISPKKKKEPFRE